PGLDRHLLGRVTATSPEREGQANTPGVVQVDPAPDGDGVKRDLAVVVAAQVVARRAQQIPAIERADLDAQAPHHQLVVGAGRLVHRGRGGYELGGRRGRGRGRRGRGRGGRLGRQRGRRRGR